MEFLNALDRVYGIVRTVPRYHCRVDTPAILNLFEAIEAADIAAMALGLKFPDIDVTGGISGVQTQGWIRVPWRHYRTSVSTNGSDVAILSTSMTYASGVESDGMEFLPTDEWNQALRMLKAQAEQFSFSDPKPFKNWKRQFGWGPTNWKRYRKNFPDAFIDVPGKRECQIRNDFVNKWAAEGSSQQAK